MLAIDNRTAYAAERTWVRDQSGAHHWAVSVKATFDVRTNGEVGLADEQPAPLLAPEHWGEPGVSSLRYDAEVGFVKPTTDVVINGSARPGNDRPVPELLIGLRFADVNKSLRIVGDRPLYEGIGGMSADEPRPFTSMPVIYERAFGGADILEPDIFRRRFDARNPLGKGFGRPEALAGTTAPNILYPIGDESSAGPAGFGAIESYWSPRRELAGTYDAQWLASQHPFLPLDWDVHSTLCAPVDQRPRHHLRGGETILVLNMTPDGLLRCTLPRIYLTFATFFGSRREEHRSKLTTVVLLPDERKVSLVWQTTLRVPLRDMEYLDRTLIREKPYIS